MTSLLSVLLAGFSLALLPSALSQKGDATQGSEAQAQDASGRYQQLESEFGKEVEREQEEQRRAYEEAKDSGKPMISFRMGPSKELTAAYLERFQAAAADYAGSEGAIPFHIWIARMAGTAGRMDAGLAALDTLTSVHLKSEKLEELPSIIGYGMRSFGAEKGAAYLQKIEKGNPHGNVQAQAILVRIQDKLSGAAVDSADYKAARADAVRAIGLSNDKQFCSRLQGMIDLREKFAEGMLAPDIVGVDLDGASFKLSDYKGKVIMLDFWGDW